MPDGIGEKLTPVKCDFRPYFYRGRSRKGGAATDEVYTKFDEIDPQRSDGTGRYCTRCRSSSILMISFQILCFPRRPRLVLPEIEDVLTKLSATSTMVNMTGSGSAVYAVYETYSQAFEILQKYKKRISFHLRVHLRGQRKRKQNKKRIRIPVFRRTVLNRLRRGFLFVVYDKRENIFRRLKCRDMRRNGVF